MGPLLNISASLKPLTGPLAETQHLMVTGELLATCPCCPLLARMRTSHFYSTFQLLWRRHGGKWWWGRGGGPAALKGDLMRAYITVLNSLYPLKEPAPAICDVYLFFVVKANSNATFVTRGSPWWKATWCPGTPQSSWSWRRSDVGSLAPCLSVWKDWTAASTPLRGQRSLSQDQ